MSFDPYAYDRPAAATQPPPLAADDLLAVPEEAQRVLWRGLMHAIEGTLGLWERTPPARRSMPNERAQAKS